MLRAVAGGRLGAPLGHAIVGLPLPSAHLALFLYSFRDKSALIIERKNSQDKFYNNFVKSEAAMILNTTKYTS